MISARSVGLLPRIARLCSKGVGCTWQRTGARVQSLSRRAVGTAATAIQLAGHHKVVGSWLIGCAGLAFGTVVAGGVTRLTESGLSIVDWHPVRGLLPPTTQKEWEAQFDLYKQFPEYKYNSGITMEQFKSIWLMEYAHRMLGRLVGAAYTLPAIYFWKRGWILPQYKLAVVGLGALIGCQGLLGWFMVKSGLEHDPQGAHVPRVSHYRLAAHLGTAFALYSGMLWTGLSHWRPLGVVVGTELKKLRLATKGTVGLVFVTALSGAFVAGLDAGLVYNSFPKMGDDWIPADLLRLEPKFMNFLENPTTGLTTGATVALLYGMARPLPLHPRARLAVRAMLGMVVVQVTLGISTLLYFVPTPLAATHQAGSLTLLTFAVWFLHELRRVGP